MLNGYWYNVSMEKLLLVDGNAIMHRAFHALPPLTNSEGIMTNAVYGFFSMLLNCIKDQKPTHIIVCFDKGKPTFRQTMYAGYHEHRPPMVDGLGPQFALVQEALEKLKVPVFSVEGYEGDDMVGTIARQATETDTQMHVVILTGDRDMLQLVTPQVSVLMPIVGVKNTALFDETKVEEKYGVHPRQFIDYKALIGDQSDGYPGVSGIGPKTAATLLQKYRDFENLYAHISELSEKQGTQLATDAEQAALAKKLATIVTDAPITFHKDESSVQNFSLTGLKESFEAHGFQSLLARFKEAFEKAEAQQKTTDESEQMTLL